MDLLSSNIDLNSIQSNLIFLFLIRSSNSTKNRSSLPKQDPSKEEKTPHFILKATNLRIRETISQTKISSLHRKSNSSQKSQNDRCSSKDLVSKQTHKMEVRHQLMVFGRVFGQLVGKSEQTIIKSLSGIIKPSQNKNGQKIFSADSCKKVFKKRCSWKIF